MKRILIYITLSIVLILGVFIPAALGQRRDRDQLNRCRQEYNQAVRRAKRERGRERRARLEQAKREYRDCQRGVRR